MQLEVENFSLRSALSKTRGIISYVDSLTDKPLIVNFSGGKDSSAMILSALEVTDDVEAIYMHSGYSLPGVIDFVKEQAEKLGVKLHISEPDSTLSDLVRWWGYFPTTLYPFCSKYLKVLPSYRYLKEIYGEPIYRLVGVRQPESSRRKSIYQLDDRDSKWNPTISNEYNIVRDSTVYKNFMVYPILHWTDDNVKQYLKDKSVKIEKNYESFGVSDCGYCPFYQTSIFKKIFRVYPELPILNEVIELEEELGKPSVAGNLFLKDIKKQVLNQKSIIDFC